MKRDTLYIIGRRTFEKQQIGDRLNIELANDQGDVGDGNYSKYYDVLFGKDNKGRMYMALATKEWGVGEWHGAHKSGGHWHGAGCSHFIKGYQVKLRKNFKDADEANRYYNIVKINMYNRTVQDSENPERRFTEEQITKFFA